ncbi:MAG: ribosomal-processing cysteine protease Prp [Spirochaetales bacterium]|nr:ribosomal-processing cysteine protease Prp [Spirochaetales bacterium]
MIKFNIVVDDQQIISSILMKGHSGFDIKGKDIVCSAVSTLIAGFVLSIGSLNTIKFDQKSDKPGFFEYKLFNIDETEKLELASYSKFLLKSLLWIETGYGDFCKLDIKKTGAR